MKFSNSTRIAIIFSFFTFIISIFFIIFFNFFSFKGWYIEEKQEVGEIILGYNIYSKIFNEILSGIPDKQKIQDFLTQKELKNYKNLFDNLYKKNNYYYLIEKISKDFYIKYDVTTFIKNQIIQIKIGIILVFIFTILAFTLSKLIFSKLILKELYILSKNLEKLNISNQEILSNNFYDINIKNISNKINKLLEKIYNYQQDLKYFNSQVAHEFKTPLMIMNSELEYLNLLGIENESLKKIYLQIEKLNNLLNIFINLTKLDKQQFNFSLINFEDVLKENLFDLKKLYKNKNIKIKKYAKKCKLKTNKELFTIILKNLLDNAFKYNKKGGNIEIHYDCNKLIISNTTKNFNVKNIDKIFNMFYKINHQNKGFGIGLAIVKKIIDKLNYKISINYNNEVLYFIIDFNNKK